MAPQPPHNTKASPQYKEASAEERASALNFLSKTGGKNFTLDKMPQNIS